MDAGMSAHISEQVQKQIEKLDAKLNKDRVITVVLRIKDQAQAGAIWEAFRTDSLLLGARVTCIANGDTVGELSDLEAKYNGLADLFEKRTGDTVEDAEHWSK